MHAALMFQNQQGNDVTRRREILFGIDSAAEIFEIRQLWFELGTFDRESEISWRCWKMSGGNEEVNHQSPRAIHSVLESRSQFPIGRLII